MDKRYQIFISSTFKDLVAERQAVLKAVLEMNHMPAGMELFPAVDDGAWQLIRDVIDSSDYYILVVGGRYGSTDASGIGYTEKEYDYARSIKRPVMAFLHSEPASLARDKTETDDVAWKKLSMFRKKVEANHTCTYWSSEAELKVIVILALSNVVKRSPAVGWIRADQVPSGATVTDVLKLKQQIVELEELLEKSWVTAPEGTSDLESGEDYFSFNLKFHTGAGQWDRQSYEGTFHLTWNQIFSGIAPSLINDASDDNLRTTFRLMLLARVNEFLQETDKVDLAGVTASAVSLPVHDYDTCIIQLRALGLIRLSDKRRSVKDAGTFWALTPYGDHLMVQLRAVRRSGTTASGGDSISKVDGEDELVS